MCVWVVVVVVVAVVVVVFLVLLQGVVRVGGGLQEHLLGGHGTQGHETSSSPDRRQQRGHDVRGKHTHTYRHIHLHIATSP